MAGTQGLIPLIYALHSGNLYGSERMALATVQALKTDFVPTVLAPPGPVHQEGRRIGITTHEFQSIKDFTWTLQALIRGRRQSAFVATGVSQSATCLAFNAILRRKVAHLHIVHGGAEERLSYGRKHWLNGRAVKFVAVSSYVRERLVAHGVAEKQVRVIENFYPKPEVKRRRPLFGSAERDGTIRRIAVVSRLDPEKRVDLLLDALERDAGLRDLEFHVYGSGWNASALMQRARSAGLNVHFAGFRKDIQNELVESDLLLHLCPVEPFGLMILEAMAARVPVLVPDSGGAASLVRPGVDGFRFRANDAANLAEMLHKVRELPHAILNGVLLNAEQLLHSRFCEQSRAADYRQLILEQLA